MLQLGLVLQSTALYTDSGSALPNLSSVSPARSVVLNPAATSGDDIFVVTDWTAAGGAAVDAVTAVLMSGTISADFDVAPGMKSELIATMPTKRFYVRPASAAVAVAAPTNAIGPFTSTFASTVIGDARSCDESFVRILNRNGASGTYIESLGLCWSVSSVTFARDADPLASASIFGSTTGVKAAVPAGAHQGQAVLWPKMSSVFDPSVGPGQTYVAGSPPSSSGTNSATGGLRNVVAGGNRYRGLPIIGFVATQGIFSGQGYGGLFGVQRGVNIRP